MMTRVEILFERVSEDISEHSTTVVIIILHIKMYMVFCSKLKRKIYELKIVVDMSID